MAVPLTERTELSLRRLAARSWRDGDWEVTRGVLYELARRRWIQSVTGLEAVRDEVCVVTPSPHLAEPASNWDRLQAALADMPDRLVKTAVGQYPAVDGNSLRRQLDDLIPENEADLVAPPHLELVD